MSIKKSLYDAMKLGFYLVWFFVLSALLITLWIFISYPEGSNKYLLATIVFNILFFQIWKKYYYFSLSDLYSKLAQLRQETIVFAKGVLSLVVIVIILIVFWYVSKGGINLTRNLFKNNQWTLMVCETQMENGIECYDNSYSIPGFKTQKECMLEGVRNFSKDGFECGKNCEESEYGLKICDVICNKAGCSE